MKKRKFNPKAIAYDVINQTLTGTDAKNILGIKKISPKVAKKHKINNNKLFVNPNSEKKKKW